MAQIIMNLLSLRSVNFIAFLLCAALLVAAINLELIAKLSPCPLCIMQRIVFICLGLLFLIGSFLHFRPRLQRYYHLVISFFALIGIYFAGRHVWLTFLPANQVPTCGANLKYLFQVLPWSEALKVVLQGSGSCAKVTWRLLGLSLPEWSLLCFIFFLILALWQAFRKPY